MTYTFEQWEDMRREVYFRGAKRGRQDVKRELQVFYESKTQKVGREVLYKTDFCVGIKCVFTLSLNEFRMKLKR